MLAFQPVGSEFRVNMVTANNQRFADIGMDADGDYVVVWQSTAQDGDAGGIFARAYLASGTPRGDEFLVNTTTLDTQALPSVAVDADGDFVVAWQSYNQDGDGYGVFAQRFNAQGAMQGGEFPVNTFTDDWQHQPDVAIDADGDFVVVWQSYNQDGGGYGVYGQKFTAVAAPVGGEFRANEVTADWQYQPTVAMDAIGNFVVAWTSAQQDGDSYGVYARRYTPNAAPQGGEFRINTITADAQQQPSVAMDDAGNFVVAWQNVDTNASVYEIRAQRFSPAGAPQGNEFVANTFAGYQALPSVAMDADGDFLIGWDSLAQDGAGYGAYAQKFTKAGVKIGNELQLNTFTAGDQKFSAVALDDDGDAVTAWQSNAQDGSSYGIYAQRLIATVKIIDDGEPGFSTSSGWGVFTGIGVGRNDDEAQAYTPDAPASSADWLFAIAAPGRYRVSATWFVNPQYFYLFADSARFAVSDSGVDRAARVINQQQPANDFTLDGSTWEDIATVDVTGNQLLVHLTSTNAHGYLVADAIRVERIADLPAAAEIQVTESSVDVADNTGFVDFGAAQINVPLDKTFTISNVGGQTLSLTLPITVPAGYQLLSGPGQTDLGPGASTSFVVRLNATARGTFSGPVSFGTNDSDENPFNFTITGLVQDVRIVDDGDPGYTQSAAFQTSQVPAARGGDVSLAYVNSAPTSEATWTASVTPGRYRISATWFVNAEYFYVFADQAKFTVLDAGLARGARIVNQQQVPNDFTADGSTWEEIATVDITGTSALVQLTSANANGNLSADAIRFERIGELPTGAEVQVTESGIDVADNTGVVDFGSVLIGSPLEKTFTIANTGAQDLTLTLPITVPAGFELASGPGQTTLAPGASTTFAVRLTAAQSGVFSGDVSFGTNDSDENPFNFTVSGAVAQIIDDGDPAYLESGDFQTAAVSDAYGGDVSFVHASHNPTSRALWNFGVTPGRYRVAATWFDTRPPGSSINPSYSSAAPFTVLDGDTPAGTFILDQQDAPDDFASHGRFWENVGGEFDITTGVLTVRLNVGSNGFVLADAIRIIRTGDLTGLVGNSESSGSGSGVIAAPESQTLRQEPPPAEPSELTMALAFSSDELTDLAISLIDESDDAASGDVFDELPPATDSDVKATDLALDDWA